MSSAGTVAASILRVCAAAVRSVCARAAAMSASLAGVPGSAASNSAPTSLPASTRKRCPAASINSVSARSCPPRTAGPVFIALQKQVSAATAQLTATSRTASRRAA